MLLSVRLMRNTNQSINTYEHGEKYQLQLCHCWKYCYLQCFYRKVQNTVLYFVFFDVFCVALMVELHCTGATHPKPKSSNTGSNQCNTLTGLRAQSHGGLGDRSREVSLKLYVGMISSPYKRGGTCHLQIVFGTSHLDDDPLSGP